MKFIPLWSKWSELKLDLSFSPQLIFSWNNMLTLVSPWTWHLSLWQKHKLRVANVVNNLFISLTQLWALCSLTHGKALSWRWILWGMLCKVGLKEYRERKNKSKVTQEPVEIKKNTINTSKKRRESLTQMKKEWKIARWKNMRNWAK